MSKTSLLLCVPGMPFLDCYRHSASRRDKSRGYIWHLLQRLPARPSRLAPGRSWKGPLATLEGMPTTRGASAVSALVCGFEVRPPRPFGPPR